MHIAEVRQNFFVCVRFCFSRNNTVLYTLGFNSVKYTAHACLVEADWKLARTMDTIR